MKWRRRSAASRLEARPYSPLATQRVREIAVYIRERHPVAARAVQKEIREAFTLLATYPEAGRAVEHGVRRFVVPRRPYVIYYRVDDDRDEVVIVTVQHGAQGEPQA